MRQVIIITVNGASNQQVVGVETLCFYRMKDRARKVYEMKNND
ncbi:MULTISPECIES: hypothetical protein [Shewanella]|nr:MULTISPECIES: hypothetical protein [Shewanella]